MRNLKNGIFTIANKIFAMTGRVGVCAHQMCNYYILRRHFPNFIHPKDLSEHLLLSIQKKSFLKYADLADKVKVRDYIKSKGLGDILLECYGVWDNADQIDISQLPAKFALKPNNGSGGHVFCKGKSTFNMEEARKTLNNSLKLENIAFAFEPHYGKITPKIYCEELIDTGGEAWPVDYKFTCINGRIVDVFVAVERETGSTKYCTLDTEWNILPYTKKEYLPQQFPAKPAHLSRMIEIAELLSADFPFVRVDLYEYKNQVYFSELTFSPWGGYMYSYTDDAMQLYGEKFNKTHH